jgi:hypothetical protein
MIEKADQVREHVERNAAGFAPDVAATIRALYPPREQFAAYLKEDADRFAAAVKRTGAHLSQTEPIVALALRYTQELDLTLAAAEAGLDVQKFLKLLERSPDLARTLGPLNAPGGTVQRDVFVAAFRDLARVVLGDIVAAAPSPQAPVAPVAPVPSVPVAGVPVAGVPGDLFTSIETAVKENRVQLVEKGFIAGSKQLRDIPTGGGILIGFNAGAPANGPFGARVTGLQPIYLTRSGEKLGEWIGPAAATPTVIKAKPGYVVGAIHLRVGAVFESLAVTFVRFDRDRIQATDTYASAWIGAQGGSAPTTVGGPEALIVGVCGRVGISGNVCALGTVSARMKE